MTTARAAAPQAPVPGSSAGRGARPPYAPPCAPSDHRLPHAALRRGCRPRGCRAPARRVHGRRVRYHIGCEPGQINGRRWRLPTA
ncbi:tryptophan synthase subunit(beta) [Streptomyces armeniacus]|uniref:Tryptophan synthase subunit(Beta) n=1 Tax=Streptomyces armeniacus TaxID=83291 RepID=A0A345XWK3_9ACTN|nr:tryptophan synthase subunit(beta) [Streptomyces armeniacus]